MAEPDEYKNDGGEVGVYYPKSRDADNRELEGKVQKNKASSSYPILEDLIKWFDEQIAEAGDVESIEVKEMRIGGITYKRNVSVEGQVLAMKILKRKLEEKQAEYKNWKDELDDTGK